MKQQRWSNVISRSFLIQTKDILTLVWVCLAVTSPVLAQAPNETNGMQKFLFSQILTLSAAIPLTFFIIKFFFKNSILSRLVFLWVINIVLMDMNTTFGENFREQYPQYISFPMAVTMTLFFIYLAYRSVKKPLTKTFDNLVLLSKGHLNIDYGTNQKIKTDLDDINKAIFDLTQNQRNILQQLNSVSTKLSRSGEDLNSYSQLLVSDSSHLSSSIEEISASMEEMQSTIEHTVSQVVETENTSKEASKSIQEVSSSLNQSIVLIENVSEKVEVINEIAQQTNLLSLNAAIEAARAGNSGKGFAVVASEVRKLAEMSAEAATEINLLAEENVCSAQNSGKQLEGVIPKVNQTLSLLNHIVYANQEQKAMTQQVNSSLQSLNKVSQKNITSSDSLARKSEELIAVSKELKKLLEFFKV